VLQAARKEWNVDNRLNDVVTAFGALAEMSHIFYTKMRHVGASEAEATAAMQAFIQAQMNAINNKSKQNGNNK
jgi:hypothetical protein